MKVDKSTWASRISLTEIHYSFMVQRRSSLKPSTLKLNDAECWRYRGEGKTGLVVTNNCGLVSCDLLIGSLKFMDQKGIYYLVLFGISFGTANLIWSH